MEHDKLSNELENVRDVCDFFIKWRQFRHLLDDEQVSRPIYSDAQKKCIEWLVLTMDRISILDLVEGEDRPVVGDNQAVTRYS